MEPSPEWIKANRENQAIIARFLEDAKKGNDFISGTVIALCCDLISGVAGKLLEIEDSLISPDELIDVECLVLEELIADLQKFKQTD